MKMIPFLPSVCFPRGVRCNVEFSKFLPLVKKDSWPAFRFTFTNTHNASRCQKQRLLPSNIKAMIDGRRASSDVKDHEFQTKRCIERSRLTTRYISFRHKMFDRTPKTFVSKSTPSAFDPTGKLSLQVFLHVAYVVIILFINVTCRTQTFAHAKPVMFGQQQKGRESTLPSSKIRSLQESVHVGHANRKQKLRGTNLSKKQTEINVEGNGQTLDENRILNLVRLLFLTYYGSLGSLMPYLPVYYQSLGHGGQVIGLLGAVRPFTTFIVAPLWGLLSDQTGRPFLILQITFLVSLAAQLLVAFRHDVQYITFMVFVTALFNAPVKSLIDSMVMDQLKTSSSSYGRLRLWGQMGFGLGSSVIGYILERSRKVPWPTSSRFSTALTKTLATHFPPIVLPLVEYADKCWQTLSGYKLLFVAHALLSIPTWYSIQAFRQLHSKEVTKAKVQEKQQKQEINLSPVLGGLRVLFHSNDVLLFFFLVLVVGISSGIIENFAYVRIREVGGTGQHMGISRLVSSLAGAPMFWFSAPLTRVLGADRVLVLSLLSYVTRFLIYAAMRHPYHGLPAEILRGVTFAAFWSTGTIYAHRVSPPGLHATMLLFLNAMYGGLGQSVGAIIGGKLQDRYGTVRTFKISAAFDFVFVCAVIMYLRFNTKSSFRNPQPITFTSPLS
jgi:MFS family permease